MKIRNGFVSNSSSTSFCIYGICVDDSQQYGFDEFEDMEKIFEGTDIDVHYGYESTELFIGKSWSDIRDDQTGAEFKSYIQTIIKEKIPNCSESFSTFEECWRDG